MKVFILTFNQGGNSDIDTFENIKKLYKKSKRQKPDIYVLALQEAKDAFVLESFHTLLFPKYTLSDCKVSRWQANLGEMHLRIYISSKFSNKIDFNTTNDFVCDSLKQAFIFTKGVIYCTFTFRINKKTRNIIFACAHLPSHPSKDKERTKCLEKALNNEESKDIMFIAGDLNYRTFPHHPDKETSQIIEKWKCSKNKSDICFNDFCITQQNKKLPKQLQQLGIKEGIVNFCPTCKIKRKKERSFNKKRFPSWCDRIIYLEKKDKSVKVLEYDSFDISKSSDHLAVYGIYQIKSV